MPRLPVTSGREAVRALGKVGYRIDRQYHHPLVMPQQIRTISKRRFLERAGMLEDEAIQIDLENRLLEHLGIDFEAEEV